MKLDFCHVYKYSKYHIMILLYNITLKEVIFSIYQSSSKFLILEKNTKAKNNYFQLTVHMRLPIPKIS